MVRLADVYEVKDWPSCIALIVCGAQAVIALDASTLALCSSVALEYEEAETISRPWFSEAQECSRLLVGTEWRVGCLDDRATIVWMWSCRVDSEDRWIRGTPEVMGRRVRVPVGSTHRDDVVELSLDDGSGRG